MTSETTSSDDWRVSDWNYGQIVTGKLNDPVANCIVGDDAAYIVKAVNNHEALVEIARAFVAAVGAYDPLDPGWTREALRAHSSARDLLASLE